MSRSERFALTALVALGALVLTLRWWLPLDESIYRFVQFHRTCRLEAWAWLIDTAVRITLGLLITAALVGGGWRDPRKCAWLAVLAAGGAALAELLKTAVERLRPNSTPLMTSGNSLPSGHVTSTFLFAAIACELVRDREWPAAAKRAAYGVAAASVVAQAVYRILSGSHWLTDTIASVLLGAAWMLGAARLRRLPLGVLAISFAALVAAFFVFDDLPGARVHVVSAMDEVEPPLAAVELGTEEARSALAGSWSNGPTEPIGAVAWALSREAGITFDDAGGRGAVIRALVRPAGRPPTGRLCVRLVASVNGWSAPPIALMRGWREIVLEPPPGVLRAGANRIDFIIDLTVPPGSSNPDPGLVAFRSLRLYAR